MKEFVLGLIGLAMLGGVAALGQTPPAASPGTACGTGCGHTKTVCVPECYIRTKTKVVYSSGSEPMCLAYFRGLFPLCRCTMCGCDDAGRCGPPYARRYLIKKVRTCDEYATKCVPIQVPACRGACQRPECVPGTISPKRAPDK
jgi:hypothetical protein